MNRKWTVFGLAAGVLVTLSLASLSTAEDKKHGGELEEIMEKVQKHNTVITKGTRNPASFKKAQKDIEVSALALAKIAKEIKPMKGSLSKAKDTADPAGKWAEICDHFFKSSEGLAKIVAKADAGQAEAKTAFNAVKKTCTDCHSVFRVEE